MPKTVKGYLKLLRELEKLEVSELKDYEKLSYGAKSWIGVLQGQISNNLHEFDLDR